MINDPLKIRFFVYSLMITHSLFFIPFLMSNDPLNQSISPHDDYLSQHFVEDRERRMVPVPLRFALAPKQMAEEAKVGAKALSRSASTEWTAKRQAAGADLVCVQSAETAGYHGGRCHSRR